MTESNYPLKMQYGQDLILKVQAMQGHDIKFTI